MKRILSMVVAVVMMLSMFASPVWADECIKVILDGTELSFDVEPQLINDRTMVPLRVIFEALGATVEWDDPTQTVRATKGAKVVVMQINNNEMTVDGNKIILDVPPQLVDSRTLVPVRAVAEGFDAQVDWVDESQSVIITSNQSIAGTVQGNVYENSFIGIGCKLDENWVFADREEIKGVASFADEYISDEYKEATGDANIWYDMVASNALTAGNVNVNIEKVNINSMDNINCIDIIEEAALVIEKSYKDMGASDFAYEIDKITVDGREVDALIVAVDFSGIIIGQVAFPIKCNGYIANISFSSMSAEELEYLINSFYWID